jgi:hypothetical protein
MLPVYLNCADGSKNKGVFNQQPAAWDKQQWFKAGYGLKSIA